MNILTDNGGSSDSKIAGNILNLEREPDLYEPVPAYKWEGLLRDQIFAESVIGVSGYYAGAYETAALSFYCLKCIQGPDTDYGLEVDHIIPQTLFNESSIERKDVKYKTICLIWVCCLK